MSHANGASATPNDNHSQPASMDTVVATVKAKSPVPLPRFNSPVKGPRDAQLIHLILANNGVHQYQERVTLQLMDFAYRYASSTLQDALHFSTEGQGLAGSTGGAARTAVNAANPGDMSSISLGALRLSIASRAHYQYNPTLPKEFYQDMAQERNRVALPAIGKEFGLRLPQEQYCLTGVGWGLKEEWDEEVLEDEKPLEGILGNDEMLGEGNGDGDEEGDERMEDIFGEQLDAVDGDRDMQDG